MNERNILSGTAATYIALFMENGQNLLIWLILSLVLIIGDLRFGIKAARKRGEKIRPSRALRRSVNKFVDYICWVSIAWLMGAAFGNALGVPLLAIIIMAVVCAIELSSIFDNYCEYKGLKKRLNVFKFFARLFRHPELEDVFEDTDNQSIQEETIKVYENEDSNRQRPRD